MSVSGSYSDGVYSGAISGVNIETQSYNVSVKVNDIVVCTFIIKGKAALEIEENSKNINVVSNTETPMSVTVLNTEDLVSSFDISAEGLTTKTGIKFTNESDNNYEVVVSSDNFDFSENGTYDATLTANMAGGRTLTDTFTLTINLTDDQPIPVDPEEH